jgi:hypothetical protein
MKMINQAGISRRLSYDDVLDIITYYAPEILPHFTNGCSRFPVGGKAAMIANYLNDISQHYYNLGFYYITKDIVNAAGEITHRCS